MPNTINYVKFLRGTPAAFARSVKDANTLYFISEVGASTGQLYLGNKLIAGSAEISASSLSELQDVVLSSLPLDGQVLAFDGATEKWVNKTLDEVLVEVMTGATSEQNGAAGLVPAPTTADINKFLRGDGTWATIPAPDVSGLQATIATLVGSDTSKSVRTIAAEEIANLVGNAPAALDTLEEIANWIQNHPDDVTALAARVTANEGNITLLQTSVGNLQTSLSALSTRVDNIESSLSAQISEINERLIWEEMTEEETE